MPRACPTPNLRYLRQSAVCRESTPESAYEPVHPGKNGGNMDIRYLGVGVTIYLPCYLDGCGLAIGDVHFAQGDGEISGTAIEMDSDTMVTTEVIKGRALN